MSSKSVLLSAAAVLLAFGQLVVSAASECSVTEYGFTATAGEAEFDAAWDTVVAPDGIVWVAGVMHGRVDFDPTKRKDVKKSKGGGDVFITRFDAAGAYAGTLRVGGKEGEAAGACATGADGTLVIAGPFGGIVDFDPGEGKDRHRTNSPGNIFVSAYEPQGAYLWTQTFGGEDSDTARGIAVDGEGAVIVVGHFWETVDFDPGRGRDRHTAQGVRDAFVLKLDRHGNHLWARCIGGTNNEVAYGVAVDRENNIIVTGLFYDTVDFDPGPGEDIHESAGQEDAFITKLGPDGSYQWTHTFGGVDLRDWGTDVAVDDAGNVYVSGHFRDTVDFDRRGDGDVRVAKGFDDIFVTSRAADGAYRWTAHMGGTSGERGLAISVDDNLDEVVVAGSFSRTVDFDPGEGVDERTSIGGLPSDAFVTWLTFDGLYVRTETMGGTGSDFAETVAVGPDSSVVVAGDFFSDDADFDPTSGVDIHASNGNTDIFITKLYCGPCEAVERHSLTVKDKNRTLKAEVRARVPGGRVTVECAPTNPPGEPIETRVSINNDNTGSYKLKKLDKGEYACAITEVRDADGDIVCDEPAGKRVVNVK